MFIGQLLSPASNKCLGMKRESRASSKGEFKVGSALRNKTHQQLEFSCAKLLSPFVRNWCRVEATDCIERQMVLSDDREEQVMTRCDVGRGDETRLGDKSGRAGCLLLVHRRRCRSPFPPKSARGTLLPCGCPTFRCPPPSFAARTLPKLPSPE